MAPLSSEAPMAAPAVVVDALEPAKQNKRYFQTDIVWKNVTVYAIGHLLAVYGAYLVLTFQVKIITCIYTFLLLFFASQGILAGAHRYYSHKTYKAKFPLRLYLVVANTLAFQNSIWEWARDHRQHHKYSDTDADPHNANRGFFFSHAGWLMMRKHPAVIEKGKNIDTSDLEADALVMFQKNHYIRCYIAATLISSFAIPMYFWNESVWMCFLIPYALRTVYFYNATWLVNSAAHAFGYKPYDKNIKPRENKLVSRLTLGEGWHNYHHTFPWDYRAAEYGPGNSMTTAFIDICAKIGWAYDLRSASDTVIKARAIRTGDGHHPIAQQQNLQNHHPH
ncbi:acyl-CoA desaturase 3-like [Thrips palmi]|uniref:Acyl-CoA desaturase 3-like n=1 Tax=Thrips palmi TaxID=161013 RepID=A0A6P8YVJ3_THRPL|nr:acyl-CoA desaturase 3-like [Thrips palmi]